MGDLTVIPGIGRTFVRDFGRIGITRVGQLRRRRPETLFEMLEEANAREGHPTSKNYLYVIRMATYYAQGGRDPKLLKWSAWSDKAIASRAEPACVPQRQRAINPRRRPVRASGT